MPAKFPSLKSQGKHTEPIVLTEEGINTIHANKNLKALLGHWTEVA